MGRPGRSEPDFVLYPSRQNPFGLYGVVEIKRPSTPIVVERRKGLLSLSSDVATAVDQVKQFDGLHQPPVLSRGHVVILGSRGHLFIIAGLSKNLAQRVGDDIYANSLDGLLPPNCDLIPYDTLLDLFRQASPQRVHILLPAGSPSGSRIDLAFSTLSDPSQLENVDFGVSRWELDDATTMRALSRARRDAIVRVARDAATDEVVGAAACRWGSMLSITTDGLPDEGCSLAGFSVLPPYRELRTPNDTSVGDALMDDILCAIRSARGETPRVRSVIY